MAPSDWLCRLTRVFVLALFSTIVSSTMSAQTTISTGSIQGSVVDPSGAVVSNAKVIVSNRKNGQSITTSTNSSASTRRERWRQETTSFGWRGRGSRLLSCR